MKATVLVLTNRTSVSADLIAALRDRTARRAERYEFVIPPQHEGPAARAAAKRRLQQTLELAGEAGLDATGRVGDCDPFTSAVEAYDATRHDEILISTLPASTSHWLQIDLPARVARTTGALVSHVVAREPRPSAPAVHVEPPPPPGLLAPLRTLGWGRRPVKR
ncbi:MAG: hypothetical protein JWN65_1846 [Solirubrobacterales bacterium]|jgi:hypothetical protein|nr:hypothetical protein [Solirubrobacterales bacterium]